MAYDPQSGLLWTAGSPWTVSVLNVSTQQVSVAQIRVPNGPVGIVLDSKDHRIFVASSYNQSITVIDSSTFQLAGEPVNVSFTPSSLCYDPATDDVLVGDVGGGIHVLNASSGTFDVNTWPSGADPDAMGIDPLHHWLYVANGGSANVTVVNLSSGVEFAKSIPVGLDPVSVLYYAQDQAMLVSNQVSENVTEISSSGSTPGAAVITINAGAGPLAVDPSTGLVYTTEGSPGAFPVTYLAVLDPVTSTSLLFSIQLSYSFVASTFDPSTGNVYIVNPSGQNRTGNPGRYPAYPKGNSSVMVLNGSNHHLLFHSYSVGYGADSIAYDPVNRDLYVANGGDSTVSVIDPVSRTVSTILLEVNASPDSLAVDPSRNLVYVADAGTHNLTVIDGATDSVTAIIPVGANPDAVLVDESVDRIFVANCGSDNVTSINASTRVSVSSIAVGLCPSALAVYPPTGNLFVANYYSATGGYSNVTIVNSTTGMGVGSVPAGFAADAILFDPTNGYLYVANGYSYNLTVINGDSLSQVTPGIQLTQGTAESYPTDLTYDPVTAEIVVPTAFSSAIAIVGNVPTVSAVTATPRSGEVGTPLGIGSSVLNGTAPFSYQYIGLPPGCGSVDSAVVSCIPRIAGNYSVTVWVTDSSNYTARGGTSVHIDGPLVTPTLVFSANPTAVGLPLNVTTNVAGGSSPMNFAYSGLPRGCSSANSSVISCQPSASGWFLISVTVTDSLNVSKIGSALVEVVSALRVSLTVEGGSTLPLGDAVALVTNIIGGAQPYSYHYSGLPPGCQSVPASTLWCRPAMPGTYLATVAVDDSLNQSAVANATLTVLAPAPQISSFLAEPSTVLLGSATTLIVVLSQASINSTVSYSGLPPGCQNTNSTRLVCSPSAVGNFTVLAVATNPFGGVDTASTHLTVVAPPMTGSGGGSGYSVLALTLVGAACAAVGATGAVIILVALKRRRPPTQPAVPPTSP